MLTEELAHQTNLLIFYVLIYVSQMLSSAESVELLNADHLREQVRCIFFVFVFSGRYFLFEHNLISLSLNLSNEKPYKQYFNGGIL